MNLKPDQTGIAILLGIIGERLDYLHAHPEDQVLPSELFLLKEGRLVLYTQGGVKIELLAHNKDLPHP